MKSEKKKKLQIGFFQRVIPHYRLGIFKYLQTRPDMEFVLHASEKRTNVEYLKINNDKDFPFIEIRTWQIKVPFMKNNVVTIQPYAIWAIVKRKYDAIIMPDDFLDISAWLVLLLGRLLGTPVCLFGHGRSTKFYKLSYFLRGVMMRLASAGINYGDGSHCEWIKRGIPPCKLFVAYNALDTDLSEKIKKKLSHEIIENFRRTQGLAGKKVVIFCGRLFLEWKKPHILIQAMKQVISEVPDAHAVIIGDGPDKQTLIEFADKMQLSQKITFTGAIHDEECLARYFLSSKVAIIPAAAGLGVQHVFGYGVPLVVGDDIINHGPEFELVEDGVNGIICRDENVGDFAEAICRLLKNEDERLKMSRNAIKIITEKYNIQQMANGFFAAVDFCLN